MLRRTMITTEAGEHGVHARICESIFSSAPGSFLNPSKTFWASSPIGGSMVSSRIWRRISPATNSVVILGTSAPPTHVSIDGRRHYRHHVHALVFQVSAQRLA